MDSLPYMTAQAMLHIALEGTFCIAVYIWKAPPTDIHCTTIQSWEKRLQTHFQVETQEREEQYVRVLSPWNFIIIYFSIEALVNPARAWDLAHRCYAMYYSGVLEVEFY